MTKVRPIVVTLIEGTKDTVLRHAYRLKDSEGVNGEILKKVYFSQDLNKEERQKDTELREEARNKNESQREIESGKLLW